MQYPNAGLKSDYTFDMSFATTIFVDSQIEITFPSPMYNVQSYNPVCSLVGDIQEFKTCTVSGNKVTLELTNELKPSTTVQLKLTNISNPTTNSKEETWIEGFSVIAKYDKREIAETPAGYENSRLRMYPAPAETKIVVRDFDPQNEGEVATYRLSMIFNKAVTVRQDATLIIEFPEQFTEELLGNRDLVCTPTPDSAVIANDKKCVVVDPRKLQFKTFQTAIAADEEVLLVIYGITNPPKGQTGELMVSLIDNPTGSVLSTNQQAGNFVVKDPPTSLTITRAQASNGYINSYADYAFGFKIAARYIPEGGQVFLYWPNDYVGRIDGNSYPCSILTPTQTQAITCAFSADNGRQITVISGVAATTADTLATEILWSMTEVETPEYKGTTASFVIATYDPAQKIILERSYASTTTNTQITFDKESTSFNVVVQQVDVFKYTFSQEFEVKLTIPTSDRLTIAPNTLDSSLMFEPASCEFLYDWGTSCRFRVGASAEVSLGTHRITWTIAESTTSHVTRKFGKIQDTDVVVVESDGSIDITIDPIPKLKVGDTTRPIYVTLDRPIATTATINIKHADNNTRQAITVEPEFLNFQATNTTLSFTVTVNEFTTLPKLDFVLYGTGEPAYNLKTSQVEIQIDDVEDTVGPVAVGKPRAFKVRRNTANVSVTYDEVATVHYAVVYRKTVAPSSKDIVDRVKKDDNSVYIFGSAPNDLNSLQAVFKINGLEAFTKYTVYLTAVDQKGNLAETPVKDKFKTKKNYRPAKCIVYVTKLLDCATVARSVAQTLAILFEMCQCTGIDPSIFEVPGGGRMLQTTASYPYEITVTVNRDGDYGKSPQEYLRNLDQMQDIMLEYLPELDTTKSISQTISEVDGIQPEFISLPEVVSQGARSVRVQATMNTAGALYGVALPQSDEDPSSEQIIRGHNSVNKHVPDGHSASVTVLYQTPGVLEFENLNDGVMYKVLVSGTNDLPGTPDQMEDHAIKTANVTVAEIDEVDVLVLGTKDSASVLGTLGLLLAAFLV